MINYFFPPVAHSFGVQKTMRKIPFNRQVCNAISWWEKETGVKFTGKLLADSYCYYNIARRYVMLDRSDIRVLFHELQHFLQVKRGMNLKGLTRNYHRRFPLSLRTFNPVLMHRSMVVYFSLPEEREAQVLISPA